MKLGKSRSVLVSLCGSLIVLASVVSKPTIAAESCWELKAEWCISGKICPQCVAAGEANRWITPENILRCNPVDPESGQAKKCTNGAGSDVTCYTTGNCTAQTEACSSDPENKFKVKIEPTLTTQPEKDGKLSGGQCEIPPE
ncbi:MAG: hypothetical protein WBD40_22410 [Tepidisphaeraceae bacterium]